MTRAKGKARARNSKKKKNQQKNSFFLRKKKLIGEIRKYDDPILTVECKEVYKGEYVKDIFKKMKQILNVTDNGVGLAASQIGITKKIVIIKPDSKSTNITCMVNPEIIEHSKEMKWERESCLSFPGVVGIVERYTSVTVKYMDEEWKEHIAKYEEGDILSVIFQHELSHILGQCKIYNWWKNPKMMQAVLKKKLTPVKQESYEVEESEDMKKEKEEMKEPTKETKEAIEQLEDGKGNHADTVEEFIKETKTWEQNKETKRAFEDAHSGNVKSFDTVSELIEELDEEDYIEGCEECVSKEGCMGKGEKCNDFVMTSEVDDKEEGILPKEVTKKAIEELESGKGISSNNIDEFLEDTGISSS